MMYPLVQELAQDGIPVQVSCRVLQLSRQPYYRWLKQPVGERERAEAYRANALHDAHVDDPEFGHRLLADEARAAGQPMSDRTAWRICARQGWWSVFGKRKATGKSQRPGPAVHDDLVMREFAAQAVNTLWLTDITEHHTTWIPVVVATPMSIRPPLKQLFVQRERPNRATSEAYR